MTTREKQSTSLSQAAYARHRRCSRQAVAQGIAQGLLSASLVRGSRGEWRIADVEAADREWSDNTHENGSGASFATARARREAALASLAEDRLRVTRGELVEVADIEARWTTIITNSRNKLLGIPSRARQEDPELTPAQLGLIEKLIREALTDLATGGGAGGHH